MTEAQLGGKRKVHPQRCQGRRKLGLWVQHQQKEDKESSERRAEMRPSRILAPICKWGGGITEVPRTRVLSLDNNNLKQNEKQVDFISDLSRQ